MLLPIDEAREPFTPLGQLFEHETAFISFKLVYDSLVSRRACDQYTYLAGVEAVALAAAAAAAAVVAVGRNRHADAADAGVAVAAGAVAAVDAVDAGTAVAAAGLKAWELHKPRQYVLSSQIVKAYIDRYRYSRSWADPFWTGISYCSETLCVGDLQ